MRSATRASLNVICAAASCSSAHVLERWGTGFFDALRCWALRLGLTPFIQRRKRQKSLSFLTLIKKLESRKHKSTSNKWEQGVKAISSPKVPVFATRLIDQVVSKNDLPHSQSTYDPAITIFRSSDFPPLFCGAQTLVSRIEYLFFRRSRPFFVFVFIFSL